jgi:hypothetical protein
MAWERLKAERAAPLRRVELYSLPALPKQVPPGVIGGSATCILRHTGPADPERLRLLISVATIACINRT